MWTRREERRAGRARPSLTLTTAASAASPRPGCRGRTSPRPSPRWTRRRVYPSPTGARSRGGRARRRNRRSRRGPGARSPARSRSATSTTTRRRGRSRRRGRRRIERRVARAGNRSSDLPLRLRRSRRRRRPRRSRHRVWKKFGIDRRGVPPGRDAVVGNTLEEDVVRGHGRRRGWDARDAGRGLEGRRRQRGSEAPAGTLGGGGRFLAPLRACFRANDEEVGVNVSKPLTPRASLDVRAAPRSIDGGSRGLAIRRSNPRSSDPIESFESFESRPRAHGRGRGHDGYLRRVHLRQGPSPRGGTLERVRGGVPDAPALHAASRAVPLRVRARETPERIARGSIRTIRRTIRTSPASGSRPTRARRVRLEPRRGSSASTIR